MGEMQRGHGRKEGATRGREGVGADRMEHWGEEGEEGRGRVS